MGNKSISDSCNNVNVNGSYQPTQSNLNRNNPPGKNRPASPNTNPNSSVSQSKQNPKK